MNNQNYVEEQMQLLRQYAEQIKQAYKAHTTQEQKLWYSVARTTANRIKTLNVKQVYASIDARLEEIEELVLIPASSRKQTNKGEVNKYA